MTAPATPNLDELQSYMSTRQRTKGDENWYTKQNEVDVKIGLAISELVALKKYNQTIADIADVGSAGAYTDAKLLTAYGGNLIPASGRFCDEGGDSTFNLPPFNADYLTGYNGATISEGGYFEHNNSTYGGTGGALSADTILFLDAINRDVNLRRYGASFRLAKITAGTGTGSSVIVDEQTMYLACTQPVFGKEISVGIWVMALDGDLYSKHENGYIKIPQGTAQYVTFSKEIGEQGYTPFPYIYASHNKSMLLGLHTAVNGLIDLQPWPSPIAKEL